MPCDWPTLRVAPGDCCKGQRRQVKPSRPLEQVSGGPPGPQATQAEFWANNLKTFDGSSIKFLFSKLLISRRIESLDNIGWWFLHLGRFGHLFKIFRNGFVSSLQHPHFRSPYWIRAARGVATFVSCKGIRDIAEEALSHMRFRFLRYIKLHLDHIE